MGPSRPETFVCPACGASFAVSEGQKAELVERGCTHCGATVDASAFT